jgi:ATP-dependent Clp protease ATP-binding subunit ClpC
MALLCRFKDRLVDEGFNPAYGARPLRRAIQRLLEDALAERMLGGDIQEGDSVIMDVDAEGNITVLNGDKTMVTNVGVGNAGIS